MASEPGTQEFNIGNNVWATSPTEYNYLCSTAKSPKNIVLKIRCEIISKQL